MQILENTEADKTVTLPNGTKLQASKVLDLVPDLYEVRDGCQAVTVYLVGEGQSRQIAVEFDPAHGVYLNDPTRKVITDYLAKNQRVEWQVVDEGSTVIAHYNLKILVN